MAHACNLNYLESFGRRIMSSAYLGNIVMISPLKNDVRVTSSEIIGSELRICQFVKVLLLKE